MTRKQAVLGICAACVVACVGNLLEAAAFAVEPAFDVRILNSAAVDPTLDAVTSGSLDHKFEPLGRSRPRRHGSAFWLKLDSTERVRSTGIPVVVMHAARQIQADLYAARGGAAVLLPRATQLPEFRGTEDSVFTLVEGWTVGQTLYAHVMAAGAESELVGFSYSTLDRTLARGAEHARMIALVFGALMAVALAALLIWFVLADRLFILYATLFSCRHCT